MPRRASEQDRRDTQQLWPARRNEVTPPAQARYGGGRPARPGNRSWLELNRSPADVSTRWHLGIR